MFATSTKTATFLLTKLSCMDAARPRAGADSRSAARSGAERSPAGHYRAHERAAHARSCFCESERLPVRQLGGLVRDLALDEDAALVTCLADYLAQEHFDDACELVAGLDGEHVDR